MRKIESTAALRRKLIGRGLPAGYVCRAVRELEDHRDDLREEAKEQGMEGAAADRYADEKLGDLGALAKTMCQSMRRSNWWGRHPIFTFCFLPLPAFVLGSFLVALVLGLIGDLYDWWGPKSSLEQEDWVDLAIAVKAFYLGLHTAIPFWFCWLARNSFCGYRWALVTSILFALHGTLHRLSFDIPGIKSQATLTWGYRFETGLGVDPATALVPLVGFALFFVLARRSNQTEALLNEVAT